MSVIDKNFILISTKESNFCKKLSVTSIVAILMIVAEKQMLGLKSRQRFSGHQRTEATQPIEMQFSMSRPGSDVSAVCNVLTAARETMKTRDFGQTSSSDAALFRSSFVQHFICEIKIKIEITSIRLAQKQLLIGLDLPIPLDFLLNYRESPFLFFFWLFNRTSLLKVDPFVKAATISNNLGFFNILREILFSSKRGT